jgi:hypothetical protein
MYHWPLSKSDLRVEACGAVDELNATIGLARAVVKSAPLRGKLARLQKDLVVLMGELTRRPQTCRDPDRTGSGSSSMTAVLEQCTSWRRRRSQSESGGAHPGETNLIVPDLWDDQAWFRLGRTNSTAGDGVSDASNYLQCRLEAPVDLPPKPLNAEQARASNQRCMQPPPSPPRPDKPSAPVGSCDHSRRSAAQERAMAYDRRFRRNVATTHD